MAEYDDPPGDDAVIQTGKDAAAQILLVSMIVRAALSVLDSPGNNNESCIVELMNKQRPIWMAWLAEQGCPADQVAQIMGSCECEAQHIVCADLISKAEMLLDKEASSPNKAHLN